MTEPLPRKVEQRLTENAELLDRAILKHVDRVRANAAHGSRSFIGELFLALVAAYQLGYHQPRPKGDKR